MGLAGRVERPCPGVGARGRWNLGATVCVWLASFQLNYLVSHLFVADAGVASVSATDPIPWATAAVFLVPAAIMLRGPRRRP